MAICVMGSEKTQDLIKKLKLQPIYHELVTINQFGGTTTDGQTAVVSCQLIGKMALKQI